MKPLEIATFALEVHDNAVEKSFWPEDGRPWGETIALIHSELSEALEEHRAGRPRLWHMSSHGPDGQALTHGLPPSPDIKPEGWGVELADAVIRALDALAGIPALITVEQRPGLFSDSEGFPVRIAGLHHLTSRAYAPHRHGWLLDLVGACLALIGDDWPDVLRAKHAYNITRPHLHGKAY